MSEKAVLRVSDLLDWLANPKDVDWDRGLLGICESDCNMKPLEDGSEVAAQYDQGLNAKFTPGHSEFLADIRMEKKAIGELSPFITFFCRLNIPQN